MKDQINVLLLEFRFLKMLSWCLTKCQVADGDVKFGSFLVDTEAVMKEAGQALNAAGDLAGIQESKVESWDSVASVLLEKIEQFKPEIRDFCAVVLDCSSKSKSCTSDEILEILDSLLGNLKDFVNWKADVTVPVKNQITLLEEKLTNLRNLVDFTAKRCIQHQKFKDFLDYVTDWTNKAAGLSLLHWLDGKDENMSARLDTLHSSLFAEIKPCTSKIIGMLVGVLKASKSSQSDKFLVGQIVASFLDFLLEDLGDPVKDYTGILKEGMIFLMTFSMDPPEEFVREVGNGLFARIDVLIKEVVSLISLLHMDEMKEDISTERRVCVSGLQYKIDKAKGEVRKLYVQIPDSSLFDFPTTNVIGFVDFFLGNLKEMLKCKPSSILFVKDKVVTLQKELLSLRPFLKDVIELQGELKDLRRRVIDVLYQAQYVVNSSLIIENPIWYDMICLASIIEELKLFNTEVKKINDQMYNTRTSSTEENSSHLLLVEPHISRIDEVVVGFKDESETIIDRLTRGTTQLDIVSIVGMPGLGKTTLAKQVYNHPSVKYYFNISAWCCVSQVYKIRELILNILSDLTGVDARTSYSNASDEDLVERLWKSLKGRRYMIVIDDIWDIGAWENIKRSLPDDNNGSRIMFTTRIHNLVSNAKLNCIPHPLRPLSDEESWELLREKLFHKDGCPADLSDVGKRIAKNCKGVPLSVVLVAGILAKTNKNLDWWKQIEESTVSKIASEGCMNVLELSYKNLPHPLRECFLYFGAFPEDRVIRARKLMNLWIAEGLIQRTDVKRSYEVAEDYLSDLIGRSLVIVSERSSKGGIKACSMHDLLRDLCLAKVQEEKFLQWVHESDVSDCSSNPKRYDKYRLCIDSEWTKFFNSQPRGHFVHSLLLCGNYEVWQRHPNPSTFFNSFKLLNVLDLECIYFHCSFPEEITLIVHLRYLAVWCYTKYIPPSIADLWNLETLIVKGSAHLVALPDTIWKMRSLRHVDIPSMDFHDCEHDDSCQLYNVDTFSTPTLNSGRETEELLRRLPRLRKLNCKFIQKQFDYKAYKFPQLSCLNGLESLKVYSFGLVFFGEKGDQFPAFDFPCSLRRLTLGRFTLPWTAISIISQLPNLEVLKLQERAFSGKRWDVEDGEFLNLKYLELWQLNIEQWSVSSDPFPSLQRLVVKNCYSLEEIPSSLGDIPTLKKIEVRWCFNASSSARRILEEQQDMGNDGLEVLVFG